MFILIRSMLCPSVVVDGRGHRTKTRARETRLKARDSELESLGNATNVASRDRKKFEFNYTKSACN